jgi:hypothetical protein
MPTLLSNSRVLSDGRYNAPKEASFLQKLRAKHNLQSREERQAQQLSLKRNDDDEPKFNPAELADRPVMASKCVHGKHTNLIAATLEE